MSSTVSLEAMFVWRLFVNGKLTELPEQLCSASQLRNKLTQLYCVSDVCLTVIITY